MCKSGMIPEHRPGFTMDKCSISSFCLFGRGCWWSPETHQPPWFGDYCGLLSWKSLPTAPTAFYSDTFPHTQELPLSTEGCWGPATSRRGFVPRAKCDLLLGFQPLMYPGQWHSGRPLQPALNPWGNLRANPMQHCAFNGTIGVSSAGSSSTSRNGTTGSQCQAELAVTPAALPPPFFSSPFWESGCDGKQLQLFTFLKRLCQCQCYQVGRARWVESVLSPRHLPCSICLQSPWVITLLGGVFRTPQPLHMGSQWVCASVHHSCPKQLISNPAAAKLQCCISQV